MSLKILISSLKTHLYYEACFKGENDGIFWSTQFREKMLSFVSLHFLMLFDYERKKTKKLMKNKLTAAFNKIKKSFQAMGRIKCESSSAESPMAPLLLT